MIKFAKPRNEDEKQFDEDMLDAITKEPIGMDPNTAHLNKQLQTLFVQNQMIISMLRDIEKRMELSEVRKSIVL